MNTVYLISYVTGKGYDQVVTPLIATPGKRKANKIKADLESWFATGHAVSEAISKLVANICIDYNVFLVIIEPIPYVE